MSARRHTLLAGKVAVVTGAGSGIGRALARALADQGARLLISDIDATRLEGVAAALRERGADCAALVADVADPLAWSGMAELAQRRWGGADILINNAGVALVAPAETVALEDARWLMDINFWGVVHGCRAFAPLLRTRPGSTIVNISSIFAMLSVPTQSIYNAAKAAVRGFSDALREELRDAGVHVLCVHPGGVRTAIADSARLGDIALAADSPAALRASFAAAARTSPEAAAAAIVRAIGRGETRLLIGADARLGDWLYRLAPARASAWVSALARRRRERRRP